VCPIDSDVFISHIADKNMSMKNAVFWDVAPCRSYVNRRFGGTYHLYLQGRKIRKLGTSMSMKIFVLFTGSTALGFTATGAPPAAKRIRILPMNQHA
jgi:hypothetical protein